MMSTGQHASWTLQICRRGASITLAFVVVLAVMESQIPPAQAQNYTVLYDFGGRDGDFPAAGLIQDEKGNLYSTTEEGGTSDGGTVFKLSKTGKETVLYSFKGGTDGAVPIAGVIRDAAGNFYGTTSYGGNSYNGTVFKLETNGTETVLYRFTGGADGANPEGLIRDSEGNLYGVATSGGTSNEGVVFKLDATGKETVLYSFTGGADGAVPKDRLIRDAAGNLYGMTLEGGNSNFGTVFKVDPQGGETALYSFGGQPDGATPFAGLIRDPQGNFYGTTFSGGSRGCGTLFKLDAKGTETVLYSFTGGADGLEPAAHLVRDAVGNLYGTTSSGASVFKFDRSGKLIVLHRFTGGTDGGTPLGPLLRDAAGDLYGTTSRGGRLQLCTGGRQTGCGLVFKHTMATEALARDKSQSRVSSEEGSQ